MTVETYISSKEVAHGSVPVFILGVHRSTVVSFFESNEKAEEEEEETIVSKSFPVSTVKVSCCQNQVFLWLGASLLTLLG